MNRRHGLLIAVVGGIVVLTGLHYTAGHEHGASPHHLYRRLYYFPILAAAWGWGVRGGIAAALAVIGSYVPHAFGLFAMHADPASTIDKVAEILLYAALGAFVGAVVDRERKDKAALSRSIVERDDALGELREAQEVLVQAEHQAAMGFLTAGLAHEIRNPLGSIRGAAELLASRQQGETEERVASLLVRETERLDDVLTRFLTFAGSESSGRTPTSLSDLAAEVVTLVGPEASQRDIDVTHIRCTATPTILLDGVALRQALLNLVLNAMQVQGAGGVVRVLSGCDDRGGPRPLFLQVEDAGPGVPAEHRGDVFHPYFSTRAGGTGVGLAVTRRVVTEQDGTIEVGDSPLGGAKFEVRLPGRAGAAIRQEEDKA
ncbi:MAG: hypothetical protein KDA24_11500 [Deltaproteobacteria bacterium]|nr:hypothetical protein [Deltaproteobacteria bacterium]